jgi:hypothetical protein
MHAMSQPVFKAGKRDTTSLDLHRLLSLEALGSAMGMSPTEVREAERMGRVFRIRSSRNGQVSEGYPAVQTVLSAKAMKAVVSALRSPTGTDFYLFFIGVKRELEGLAPVELVLGRKLGQRPLSRAAWTLLRMCESMRMEAVLAAARIAANIRVYG